MKYATLETTLAAYVKCSGKLRKDLAITATATSAGFVLHGKEKRGRRTGFQVFVRVCRFSEPLLKRKPLTGGLLCNADPADL